MEPEGALLLGGLASVSSDDSGQLSLLEKLQVPSCVKSQQAAVASKRPVWWRASTGGSGPAPAPQTRRVPRRPGTAKALPSAQARAPALLRGPTDPEDSRSRERPGCASGLLRSPGVYLVPRPDSNAHVPPAGKAGRACSAWQAARASFAKGHRGALMTVSWGSQHTASPNGDCHPV